MSLPWRHSDVHGYKWLFSVAKRNVSEPSAWVKINPHSIWRGLEMVWQINLPLDLKSTIDNVHRNVKLEKTRLCYAIVLFWHLKSLLFVIDKYVFFQNEATHWEYSKPEK